MVLIHAKCKESPVHAQIGDKLAAKYFYNKDASLVKIP